MAAKMQQMTKEMGKDCKGCTMTGKQEPKKNSCCDDKTCTAKCSSLSSVTGNTLPATIAMPQFAVTSQKFAMTGSSPPSFFLNTQERPPKHLS